MSTNSIRVCCFRVAGRLCGAPVDRVQEALPHLPYVPVPLAHPYMMGLVNLRGQIIAQLDLRTMLQLPEASGVETPMSIVLRTSLGLISLCVDDVHEVLEVDTDQIDDVPRTMSADVQDLLTGVVPLHEEILILIDAERTASVAIVEETP